MYIIKNNLNQTVRKRLNKKQAIISTTKDNFRNCIRTSIDLPKHMAQPSNTLQSISKNIT